MVYRQEVKRVFRSRTTWIAVLCAMSLACAAFFLSLMDTSVYKLSQDGSVNVVTGISAIRERQVLEKALQGEVRAEKLEDALLHYQKVRTKYGEHIPDAVYIREVYPLEPYLQMLIAASPGMDYLELAKAPLQIATEFYSGRNAKVKQFLSAQLGAETAAYQDAVRKNEQVKTPFFFSSHRGLDNALNNLSSLVLLLSFLSCVCGAQMFSGEYQSKAVIILRSTGCGRAKLAKAKILAAMLLASVLYLVSVGTYTAVCGFVYGCESFQTSIQLGNYLSVHAFTYGQVYGIVCSAGLLAVWAVSAFTLFLSSRLNAPVGVVAASFGVLVLQLAFSSVPNRFFELLSDILPSGASAVYGELFRVNYFTIGSLAVWSPYVMLFAAMVCVPFFACFAVKSYCRHGSN